jgi:hypothetical protein
LICCLFGIRIVYIKFEVIWISVLLGSRIGSCFLVTGLFGVIFENLFCFCWFHSCHYTIIIFWYLAVVWVIFITFAFVCLSISSGQTKVRFVISSLNQCSSCYKLYSWLRLLLVIFFPICVMYSPRERKQKRIVD